MPQFRQATGLRRHAAQTAIRKLIEGDVVVTWPAGNHTTYQTRGEATLADLERLAETAVDPAAERSAGRRTSVHSSREVRTITPSQLVKIRTATNTIARHLDPEARREGARLRAAKAQVGGKYMVWHDRAGAGAGGDWRAMLELVENASSKAMRAENIAAIRLLLDLAATSGWIGRTERHDPTYTPVPADWAPLFVSWCKVRHVSPQPALELLRACSRLQVENPSGCDWKPIVEHLEAGWAGGEETTKTLRAITRKAYRALREAGMIRGPEWNGLDRRRREGVALVTRSAIETVAALYGADGAQHGLRDAPWPEEFSAFQGLTGGPYGLRRFLVWATAPGDVADLYGVHPRDVYPNEAVRGKSPRSRTAWRAGSASKCLQAILYYAGWLARERGVDWSSSDLRELLNEHHINGFREAILLYGLSNKERLRSTATVLARMASPWAEWVAWDEGDESAQQQFNRVSRLLYSSSSVDGRSSIVTQLQGTKRHGNRTTRRLRAQARAVEDAFTQRGTSGGFAYDQMKRVLRVLISAFVATYGELDVQLERPQTCRTWAALVRDIALLQDQLVIPLRAATIGRMDLEDRRHTPDYSRVWGAYRGRTLKTGSNTDEIEFEPFYHSPGGYYDVRLYRLYRELARPLLARNDTHAYFVNDRGRRYRKSGGLTDLFRRVVRRALAHDPQVLGGITYEDVHAVCTTHHFRHMLGTMLVARGRIMDAALLLNHASLDQVREVYSAQDERDVCTADLLA